MTVGRAIARKTGFRLFHNHVSIEPALEFFDFGHPAFIRLVEGYRKAVFHEVANSDLPGLIFTFAWAFDLPSEQVTIDEYAAPFVERGSRVVFAELRAPLDVRLERNEHPERTTAKPSKRDVERSRRGLLEVEENHVFTSGDERTGRDDWIVIDNVDLAPAAVADLVIARFGLPLQG